MLLLLWRRRRRLSLRRRLFLRRPSRRVAALVLLEMRATFLVEPSMRTRNRAIDVIEGGVPRVRASSRASSRAASRRVVFAVALETMAHRDPLEHAAAPPADDAQLGREHDQ